MTEEERVAPAAETPEMPETPTPPAAASDAGNTGNGAVDRVAELAARVAELERQLAHERDAATDYMNRFQRAQADFANFKRRAQQDQEQLQRALAAEAARLILPALDSFERAFVTLPASLRGFTWISGTELIRLQLESALSAVGIRLIEAEPGYPFDPAKHEAIGEVESAEHPAGNVAVVVQRGYQIEGYVLRPALVQLAKAAESATASSPLSPQGEEAGGEDPEPGTS
ncbi:MAG TPA: nucleotide exchange factor GrpE [Ktedonobacterales bacterium]|nr:nucleotide exchange factor GrpE [Ktedonobacterales bacterium]